MSDWPKEMNETELQFYHRSAHSLSVAFRLGCREIDRLTAELDTARDLIDDMNRLDNHMSLTDRGCNTCTHKADCDKGYADCEEWECMTVAEYIIKAKAEIAQLKAELEYLKAEQEVHGEIERARNILWAENKRLRELLESTRPLWAKIAAQYKSGQHDICNQAATILNNAKGD